MFRGIYDKQYGKIVPSKLFSIAKDDISFLQRLKLYRSLEVHHGCVNSVCWNETGSSILSGSDDQHLIISAPFTGKKQLSIRSGHRANIFSARFLPNSSDQEIVSCSGDGKICYTQVEREDTYESFSFDCHHGTVYEVLTIPNEPSTFFSCGEDGTVRWFDLRMKTKCDKQECKEDVMIKCRRAVTSLTINPLLPYQLGVACSDGAARIYDRRMLGTRLMGNYGGQAYTGLMCKFSAKSSENRSYRITSLQYSSDGEEILLSYSSEHLYLFSVKDQNGPSRKLMRVMDNQSNSPPTDCRPKTLTSDFSNSKEDSLPTVSTQLDSRSVTSSGAEPATPSTSKELPPLSVNDAPSKLAQIKRLRLRGDWSDTGPNARPASERQEADEEQTPHVTLMQRMSDMLTRWLDSNLRPDQTADSDTTDTVRREQGSEEDADSPLDGAVGGEPVALPSTRIRQSTQSPELIQNLENLEIPSKSQMDITDRLRNLSRMHHGFKRSGQNDESNSRTLGRQQYSRTECLASSETSNQKSISSIHVTNENSESFIPAYADPNEITARKHILNTENAVDISDAETHVLDRLEASTSSTSDCENRVEQTADSSLVKTFECDMDAEYTTSKPCRMTDEHNIQKSVTREVTLIPSDSTVDIDASNTCNESHVDITDTLRCLSKAYPSENQLKTSARTTPESDVRPEQTCIQHKSRVTEHPINQLETVSESSIYSENSGSSEALDSHTSFSRIAVLNNNKSSKKALCDTGDRQYQECGLRADEDRVCEQSEEPERSEPSSLPPLERLTTNPEMSNDQSSQPRRRRIGYSGPPTGDFQLYSPDNNNISSDDNSEGLANDREEEELERNVAASRLQSIFRKRQADREERDLEANQTFTPTVKQKFRGHRNARTMIKEANFWGDRFVMSGSDCGHIFFWDRHSTKLVMLLEADKHVVNCLQPHPFDPMLASSGIDYDVKVWAPISTEPYFDEEAALEIMRRNELMLEETQDTITVPAGFMFRVLASLTHIRSGRARNESDSDTD